MGRCYDNWERLVVAVMRREQFRSLSLADSRSPSIRSEDSDFSFSSSSGQINSSFRTTPSPLHADLVKLKLAQSVKEGKHGGRVFAKTRNAVWKGLSIFNGFSSKKDHGREERELQWAKAQRTLHGIEPVKTASFSSIQNYEEVSPVTEFAKRKAERKAEIARMRQLHTLKGHIESLVKAKGLDIDSIDMYYTV